VHVASGEAHDDPRGVRPRRAEDVVVPHDDDVLETIR